jgi:hypothetical protein
MEENKKKQIINRMGVLLTQHRRASKKNSGGRITLTYSWTSTEAEEEYIKLVFDLAKLSGGKHVPASYG